MNGLLVLRATTCKPKICTDFAGTANCPDLWYVFNSTTSSYCPSDMNPCMNPECRIKNRCVKNAVELNYAEKCKLPTPSRSPLPTPSRSPLPTPSRSPLPTPSRSALPTLSRSPFRTVSASPSVFCRTVVPHKIKIRAILAFLPLSK